MLEGARALHDLRTSFNTNDVPARVEPVEICPQFSKEVKEVLVIYCPNICLIDKGIHIPGIST